MSEGVSLILKTKTHDAGDDPDAKVLLDADLAILGANENAYRYYAQQIRQEYDWVPDTTFAARRAEILERFLARERIYSTENFFAKYETQARANLRESLRKLKSGRTFSR